MPNASNLVSFHHRTLPQWITITKSKKKRTDLTNNQQAIDPGTAKIVCCCDDYNTGKKLVTCALEIIVSSLCVVKIYAYPLSLLVRVSTRRSPHYEQVRIEASHHECRPDIADRLAHIRAHRCITVLRLQRAELRRVVIHCERVLSPNDDHGALHCAARSGTGLTKSSNVTRESTSASPGVGADGAAYRAQGMPSAIWDSSRVCVVILPYIVSRRHLGHRHQHHHQP